MLEIPGMVWHSPWCGGQGSIRGGESGVGLVPIVWTEDQNYPDYLYSCLIGHEFGAIYCGRLDAVVPKLQFRDPRVAIEVHRKLKIATC